MESNNIQVITLTTTSSPESASSTSHHSHLLNTSNSSLMATNYSGLHSQDSSSNFSSSLVEDGECKRKKFKSSSEVSLGKAILRRAFCKNLSLFLRVLKL